MSYYPILRSKSNELLALRELSEREPFGWKIFPIIEPVSDSAATIRSLEGITRLGTSYGLIINPSVGSLMGNPSPGMTQLLADLDASDAEYMPFFFVTDSTALAVFTRFTRRFPTGELGVIFHDEPSAAFIAAVESEARVTRIVYFEDRLPVAFSSNFTNAELVPFRDRFNRQTRNADYPRDELFCDVSIVSANSQSFHFKDYSIVGSHFSESGGPAYAVALHHAYFTRTRSLHIRHYLSDDTTTPTDPGSKFIQALSKLVRDLPGFGQINETSVCDTYRTLFAQRHFPGLGVPKKLAISHHLELLLK